MRSIGHETVNEIVINKSRFITILTRVNSKDDVSKKLAMYKTKYKNASHYCYAYIIDSYCKFSDDGEPSGTAGVPILNVLNKNDLTNVLCLVIRYFGGIKLGAGGLVRAYSKSVSEAINYTTVINLIKGVYLEVSIDYSVIKDIDYILKDFVVSKTFDEKIIYKIKMSENDYNEFIDVLNTKCIILKQESILL